MDREEKARMYHEQGFNCAQAVLAACGDVTGLDEKQALAVAGGFGSGLNCGEVCGALSGAVMAAGMIYPHNQPHDMAAKAQIKAVAKDMCGRFRDEYGCITCRELLEMVGDRSRCPEFIEYGAELATEIIDEKG